jgi:hypothetical protein
MTLLPEWVWVIVTGLGFLVSIRNSLEARKTINAIRSSRKYTDLEKLALLYVGYGKLIRQLGMVAGIGFNVFAGVMALSIPDPETRVPIVVAFLTASAVAMSVLSMIEAVRDDP